jgi:hypothetical protein
VSYSAQWVARQKNLEATDPPRSQQRCEGQKEHRQRPQGCGHTGVLTIDIGGIFAER